MVQAKLKLKIMAGYLVLVFCLAFIIRLVHEELGKKSAMKQQETHWQGERRGTNRAFLHLLDLAITGELITGWTEDDYAAYREKRIATVHQLQDLKPLQENAVQRAAIDSVCNLLVEKERLLSALLSTLEDTPDVEEIVHRKIPALLPKSMKEMTAQPLQSNDGPAAPAPPKKNFWGFLSRKKEKSAYALQREKALTNTATPPRQTNATASRPAALLHSLKKEIADTTRIYEERLSAKVDSLRLHNRRLNERITLLISNFERNEEETFCWEIGMQQAIRNRSFSLITGTGIATFMLVILLYIIIHRDVNRGYKIRLALEAANKVNEELIAARKNMMLSVSHDLRSPLTAISGYAELLPEETDETQRNRYAENILRISRHVIGLANNLLHYYRLEAGKEQPDKEVFHPGKLIEDVALSFRPLADKKGLGLTVETEGVNTMVEGDCIRLTQILNNLLANAVKFTRIGHVYIKAHYGNGQLRFFVRDTGAGISKEKQERIFMAFERQEGKRTEPGFGLGLSITAKLVELLGGTISVESRPEHGSTFEVCLPMPEADGRENAKEPQREYINLAGLKIVLIDDDLMQADMTRRMMHRNGISCDCCCNVKELMELLRNNRYDLLLTDMQMPETDGYEVLKLLRSSNLGQSKDIPVLAVTAGVDEKTGGLVEVGFAGCLHKPFSNNELLAAVAECMNGRIPQRQDADFSTLLEGEDDRKGMLDMFVQDTEKILADLQEAVGAEDYGKISALIHKGAPLWETIRIGIPTVELERLASLSPEVWNKALLPEVRQLVEAVVRAVETAKRLREGME